MKDTIEIVWGSTENLKDIQLIEKEVEDKWENPDWFFEELLLKQRVAIAFKNLEPIGYLVFQIIWGNTPFLSLVRVLPNFQRKGIGMKLIENFENKLISQGYSSYVSSTEKINPNTKDFFHKIGLSPIGTLKMNHGEEVFYLKSLQ